ncbi:IclR family transcriptional regulator domain-containing protein [Tropicibacter sp. S64]|uniref:IclR family transcriptional regulator domain-containing protein n=1 Tax=Tropicibacter sp. S64 TaxID=3415122 RepID=UPI003C7E0442
MANVPVLLSEIDRARQDGFACNRGESKPDIGAVVVPVFDHAGEPRLTLSAFRMASRFSAAHEARIAASLATIAQEVLGAIQDQPVWALDKMRQDFMHY